MTDDARAELGRPGTLRVGINLGNILLVTGKGLQDEPMGVAPDLAAAFAERLGAKVEYMSYATPGEVADAAMRDEWDIGLIAVEPERAAVIAFCDPYIDIEATYLVPAGSAIGSIADVDRSGVRIAVSDRAAYDLYLSRHLKHATLHRAKGLAGAFDLFVTEKLDALAGLVPALRENAASLPGARVLDGRYTSVRQAIGTRPQCTALHAAANAFTAEVKANGFVAALIDKHGVTGKLQVADGD